MSVVDEKVIVADLIRDERLVLHAYQDSEGYWTIGVGRLIDWRLNGGISRSESLFLLNNDINNVISDLDRKLNWWRAMSENRQRVLINMCFNLGIEKLSEFHLMLQAMIHGKYDIAAHEMMNSLWAKEVGDRAKRLQTLMLGK